MVCDDLLRCLSDYIDGDLSESLRAEVEQHLASCRKCRVLLDTTLCTVSLYRQFGQTRVSGVRRAQLCAGLQVMALNRPGAASLTAVL